MFAVEEYSLFGNNEFIGVTYYDSLIEAIDLAHRINKDYILVYVIKIYHDNEGKIQSKLIVDSTGDDLN